MECTWGGGSAQSWNKMPKRRGFFGNFFIIIFPFLILPFSSLGPLLHDIAAVFISAVFPFCAGRKMDDMFVSGGSSGSMHSHAEKYLRPLPQKKTRAKSQLLTDDRGNKGRSPIGQGGKWGRGWRGMVSLNRWALIVLLLQRFCGCWNEKDWFRLISFVDIVRTASAIKRSQFI